MMAPATRTRLLLLGLAAAAMLGLLYWPEAEEPNWLPNPNYVRDLPRPAATIAAPAAESGEPAAPPRSPTLPDSEFVKQVAGYGLMNLALEYGVADEASFYFVDLRDSTRSLRSLGFIQASALLDSAQRFAVLADSGPATRVGVRSIAPVDSALHLRMEDCISAVRVPVRELASTGDRWTLALMPGAEPALPAGEWRARGTPADRQEALRLARQLRAGSVETSDGFLLDSTRVPGPPAIKSLRRFVRDGTEFLIADVRLVHTKRPGGTGGDDVYEQRMFIAERNASDRTAPFRVVWSHLDTAYGDEMTSEDPVMMLLIGPDRLLTLQTDGDYKDGGGGLFISRVGKGKWRVMASWYAGC